MGVLYLKLLWGLNEELEVKSLEQHSIKVSLFDLLIRVFNIIDINDIIVWLPPWPHVWWWGWNL